MSCYHVDYDIDVMEAFEEMSYVDKKEFLTDAISNLNGYNDDYHVIADAAENLDEEQKSNLIKECFRDLDGDTAYVLVQELTGRLDINQQKQLVNWIEDV